MKNKTKVKSTSNSPVTINLTDLNGKKYPVPPKGFAYLDEDELAYLINTSKIFEVGSLVVDRNTVPEGIEIVDSPNALTDENITELLKKPVKQLVDDLAEITEVNVIDRILEAANKQDKSVKVVQTIEARKQQLL